MVMQMVTIITKNANDPATAAIINNENPFLGPVINLINLI
jgi:hypothetical protein